MNVFYQVYANLFCCIKRIHKLFNEDQKPLEFSVRDSDWLSVDANMLDGTTQDITETVRDCMRHDALITPEVLERITQIENVASWGYLTKTLEYNKIPTEGVVNGL